MIRIIYIDETSDKEIIKGDIFNNVTETAELYNQVGISHRPPKDSEGIVLPLGKGKNHNIVIASKNRNAPIPSEEGETIIYSLKDGGVKSKITLKTDGSVKTENDNGYTELKDNGDIEINGSADFAVAYNDLKTKIDELNTKLNGHIHSSGLLVAPPTGGPVTGTTGTSTSDLSTDISSAKVSTVKLP